eukprot:gene10674-22277_t
MRTILLINVLSLVSLSNALRLQFGHRSSSIFMSANLERQTGKSGMDVGVLNRYMSLPQNGKIQAEYIWIDAAGKTRSKTRTLEKSAAKDLSKLPKWTFDGSSTGQAPGDDSEVIIYPQALYPDPFRPGSDNILVLCDCYTPEGRPLDSNTRAAAAAVFNTPESQDAHVWFGIEQEYTLFNLDGVTPLGWPRNGYPMPQGPYYCGAGADRVFGRAVPEAHYKVMPGQWEYQIGPAIGIEGGDALWLSRYILDRVCEDFGVVASIHPKPITHGDWNGAGLHINISTKKMREPAVDKIGGMYEIIMAIDKLGNRHKEHIAVYGEDNELRLTGKHETASIHQFSYGVANRGCSIRIPRDTDARGYGYFEDRRPASNADPYLATGKIMSTIMEEISVPPALRKDKAAA